MPRPTHAGCPRWWSSSWWRARSTTRRSPAAMPCARSCRPRSATSLSPAAAWTSPTTAWTTPSCVRRSPAW